MSIYDQIILNIKEILNEKGLRKSFVATKAGLSSKEFSDILNNRRKLLRVEHVHLIAEALGVGVNDILKCAITDCEKEDK